MQSFTNSFNNLFSVAVGWFKVLVQSSVSAVEVGLTGYDKNGDVVMTAGIPIADSLATKEDFEGMKSFELSLKWKASNGSEIYVDNAYNRPHNSPP